ncbi:MAG: response regulator [Herbaspirillum sp.]|jgi:FixJ family two-component response regulator|nr:response regulator [Herbaspirillum sp.]
MTKPTRSIAIVDDDRRVLESLANLIASFGYQAYPFTSAAEMLAADILPQVSCVITDREMPVMSGLGLLAHIRQSGLSIPVIVITGELSEDTESFYFSLGAAGFLRKPLDDDALHRLLQRCFL